MISATLVELIEIHANQLTRDAAQDLATNPRTPGFRAVSRQELEQRIFQIFHRLGNWIGDPKSVAVEAEFSDWGRRRFDQGIPISEIVYAIILLKKHLRRYISDNGLVDAAFPRIDSDYVLPMHLHSLHDLVYLISDGADPGRDAGRQRIGRSPVVGAMASEVEITLHVRADIHRGAAEPAKAAWLPNVEEQRWICGIFRRTRRKHPAGWLSWVRLSSCEASGCSWRAPLLPDPPGRLCSGGHEIHPAR